MRSRSAVEVGGGARSGEAHEEVADRAQAQAAEGHLERGRGAGVAEQAVAEEVGADVRGTGAPDADGQVAEPPEILDEGERSGVEDLDGGRHRCTSVKRTVVPGVSSAGGSRSASQSTRSVEPRRRHPPGDSRG